MSTTRKNKLRPMLISLTMCCAPWPLPGTLSIAGAPITFSSPPQFSRNQINGTVMSSDHRPVNNIRVELQDEVEMTMKQVYTDATGRYTFANLSSGVFYVKVHSNGVYVGQKVRLQLVNGRAGGGAHYEQLDFTLRTLEETKGKSVPSNSGATFAQDVPEKARKAYERALKQLENAKEIEQGIASLKEAVTVFPTYYAALERLGVELLKQKKYDDAYQALKEAIQVNPSGSSGLYAFGVVNFQLRRWTEAVDLLSHSFQLAPESGNAAFVCYYWGLSLLRLGKIKEAELQLRRAAEKSSNQLPADLHMHLAQLYSNQKRYSEAADELALFLKQTPDARDAEQIRRLIVQLREKAKG